MTSAHPLPRTRARRWAASALLALPLAMPLATQAQSLSLTLLSAAPQVGQALALRLDYDFAADPTLGGGVDLLFDPLALQFTGFAFNPALGDDAAFRRPPDAPSVAEPGRLVGLSFGHFNGLSGPGAVGTYSFMALAAGATALALQPNVVPAGSFISVNSFGPQAVAFGSLQVPVAAVPEPASAGLLLAGVLGLGWALRRRGAAATSAAGACR